MQFYLNGRKGWLQTQAQSINDSMGSWGVWGIIKIYLVVPLEK